MIIVYHKDFKKEYKKHPKKLREKTEERLRIFSKEEFDPILNNHALKGKWAGYRSINVTGDIRAIYKKLDSESAIFTAICSHSKLYK